MNNECSIVLDLLPLYVEGMLSEDTATFVKEHLAQCAACFAEAESMKGDGKTRAIDRKDKDERAEAVGALLLIRKKMRKRVLLIIGIFCACVMALTVLLHFFPVYRVMQVNALSYYSSAEIGKLLYIGSSSDRVAAQAVLRQADEAFGDCRHSDSENEEKYGLLAKYAISEERGASFTVHSLELWSAHLGLYEGYLWVYYSWEAFGSNGETIAGSYNIPSLWKVQKNDSGAWTVVDIKEHP